jgi:translation initiation factor 4G
LNLLPRQSGYVAEPQGVLGPLISFAQDKAKETVRSSQPAAQLQPAELPATDLSKKTLSLVEEYFSVVDHNEALLCVQELKAPDFHPELVRIILSLALEQRDCEYALVWKLLVHLNAEEVVSRQDLRGGCAADCRAAGGYCYGCP